ncbi:hypothetical protein BSKO_11640 [Bryopsis sp. KO-2023]|nr:hypothetical protein BSKO_11640 [Bryopsis sp. KO-2023]
MKQNLVKQTADAAKQVMDKGEATPRKANKGKKIQKKPPVADLNDANANAQEEMALEAAKLGYQEYLKFKDSMIDLEIPEPGNNPNRLSDDQLCFDPKTECQLQDFEQLLKSSFPENYEDELCEEISESGGGDDFDMRPLIQSVAQKWEPEPIEGPVISKEEIARFPYLWRHFDWASICPQEPVSEGSKDGTNLKCLPQEGELSEGNDLGSHLPDLVKTELRGESKYLDNEDDVLEPEDAPLPQKGFGQENSQKSGSNYETLDQMEINDGQQMLKSNRSEERHASVSRKSHNKVMEVKEHPVDLIEVPSCEVMMEEDDDRSLSKDSPILSQGEYFERESISNHKESGVTSIKKKSSPAQKSACQKTLEKSKDEGRNGFGSLDLVPCHREQKDQSDGISSEDEFLEKATNDQPNVFIKPDFSEENLRAMTPDVLFRNPRMKLKYRPVYGPEALCIPPPKPQVETRANISTGLGSGVCSFSAHQQDANNVGSDCADFKKGLLWDLDVVAFDEGRADVDESAKADAQDQEVVSDSDEDFWDDDEGPPLNQNMDTSDLDGAISNHMNLDHDEPLQTTLPVDHYDFDVMLSQDTPSPQRNRSVHSFPKGRSTYQAPVDANVGSSRKGFESRLRSAFTLMEEAKKQNVPGAVLKSDHIKGREKDDMVVDQDEPGMGTPSETHTPSAIQSHVNCSTIGKGVESDDDFLLPPCHVLFEHTQVEEPMLPAGKGVQLDSEPVLGLHETILDGGATDCGKDWECHSVSSVEVSDCNVVMDVEQEHSEYQVYDSSDGQPHKRISEILEKNEETEQQEAPSIHEAHHGESVEIKHHEIRAGGSGTQSDIGDCEILMCDAFSSEGDGENDEIMERSKDNRCGVGKTGENDDNMERSNDNGCGVGETGMGASKQQDSLTTDVVQPKSIKASGIALSSDQADAGMTGKAIGIVPDSGNCAKCAPEPWQIERGEAVVQSGSPTVEQAGIQENAQSEEPPSTSIHCSMKGKAVGMGMTSTDLCSVDLSEQQSSFDLLRTESQSILEGKPSSPSNDQMIGHPAVRPKRMRDELCDQMIKEALKEDAKSRMDLGPLISEVTTALLDDHHSGPSCFSRLLATLRGSMHGGKSTVPLNPQRLLFALLHVAHQNNNMKDSGSRFEGQVRLAREDGSIDIDIFTR